MAQTCIKCVREKGIYRAHCILLMVKTIGIKTLTRLKSQKHVRLKIGGSGKIYWSATAQQLQNGSVVMLSATGSTPIHYIRLAGRNGNYIMVVWLCHQLRLRPRQQVMADGPKFICVCIMHCHMVESTGVAVGLLMYGSFKKYHILFTAVGSHSGMLDCCLIFFETFCKNSHVDVLLIAHFLFKVALHFICFRLLFRGYSKITPSVFSWQLS